MNKNMFAMCCFIEGLRNLERWEDSDIKSELMRQKTMLSIPDLRLERMVPDFVEKYLSYVDPMGKKISLFEWSCAFEWMDRHVGEDHFRNPNSESVDDEISVSTIWTGNNNSWSGGLLILETMIFGIKDDGELDRYQERYSTLDQAEEGHKAAVSLVLEYIANKLKIKETP